MRSALTGSEVLVGGVILAFCAVAAVADPGFLSIPTLTDLLRVDYRISRIVSGAITYLFNFFMRRTVLYRTSAEK